MRTMLLSTSLVAAMAIGSTAALAQSQQSGQSGTSGSSSSQSTQAASSAVPKAMTQDKVRQVMRDAGFTDVKILDASYLVQASTKDGDQILVVLNPPMMDRSGQPAATGSTGGSSGGSGSQSGSTTTAPKQ